MCKNLSSIAAKSHTGHAVIALSDLCDEKPIISPANCVSVTSNFYIFTTQKQPCEDTSDRPSIHSYVTMHRRLFVQIWRIDIKGQYQGTLLLQTRSVGLKMYMHWHDFLNLFEYFRIIHICEELLGDEYTGRLFWTLWSYNHSPTTLWVKSST